MRYFVMTAQGQQGPYELEQLVAVGVRPGTYVWCKGMPDWQKAEDVADICRLFRQHIFDIQSPSAHRNVDRQSSPGDSANFTGNGTDDNGPDPYESVPARFRNIVRKSGQEPGAPFEQPVDTSRPPFPTLFLSLLMTLFCFPFTGIVAAYYSYMARKAWTESQRSESPGSHKLYSEQAREELRRRAHDYQRQAFMWLGITFFLSLILYAFLGHKFL